jgi:hypothetical protein
MVDSEGTRGPPLLPLRGVIVMLWLWLWLGYRVLGMSGAGSEKLPRLFAAALLPAKLVGSMLGWFTVSPSRVLVVMRSSCLPLKPM